MKFNRREYKALACAIALATGVTASYGTAQAAEAANAKPAVAAATAKAPAAATATTAKPAANKPMTEREKWQAARPSDEAVTKLAEKYTGKTIVDVKFDGVTDDIIKTVEASRVSKQGDKFSLGLIEKDANNIYDTGYFYDLYPSFKEVPEGVIVTYHLLETPRIKSIAIEGNSKAESTAKVEKTMKLRAGDRLNRRSLHDDITAIQKMYVNDGYVMAKISDLGVDANGKLGIKINEGILEGYKIKGLKKTKEKVVLRELRTKVGQPLNKKQVVRSYQRLTNLGYFETLDIKPIPGVEPNACVLEIDVTEKNTGTFGIGAGYSSSDGLIGMLSLGDSNFRGIGDSVNITYTIGGGSSDARGYTFSYFRPWLDKKQTSGTLRIYNRTYQYDEYDTEGNEVEEFMRKYSGFEIGFGRPQSEYTSNFITFRNRSDRYESHEGGPTDRSGEAYAEWRRANFGLTRSLIFQHATDTRDNRFYPTSGQRAVLGVEWAGFGGDFNFRKYTIDDSHYFKAGRNQVFAIRGSYGHSTTTMPFYSQFRIGGQDTLRGYRDDQFRGNSMVLGTVEYRFPLASKMKGSIFSDFGSAWDSGWMPSKLHASIGVGVLIETPVGPLRLDLGHGSNGNRLHFNIGTSF